MSHHPANSAEDSNQNFFLHGKNVLRPTISDWLEIVQTVLVDLPDTAKKECFHLTAQLRIAEATLVDALAEEE